MRLGALAGALATLSTHPFDVMKASLLEVSSFAVVQQTNSVF